MIKVIHLLTFLLRRSSSTENSLTSVPLHTHTRLYLYLSSFKGIISSLPIIPKRSITTKMAFHSKVHPSSTLPVSETNTQDHHISFFPPYEEVNLATLFNHVQITEHGRIYIPLTHSTTPLSHLVPSRTLRTTHF